VGFRHSNLVYGYQDRARWDASLSQLVAEIKQSKCSNVVISSEAWSRSGTVSSLNELVSVLRQAGHGPILGLIYLRNRYGYARSLYREWTRRRGNTLVFPAYVDANAGTLDLLKVVLGLRSVFREDLKVICYESVSDVVSDFVANVGVPLEPERVHDKTNVGLDAVEVEARRLLNAAVASGGRKLFPGAKALLEQVGVTIADPTRWCEKIDQKVLKCGKKDWPRHPVCRKRKSARFLRRLEMKISST
jgi:hypothetical protein